MCTKPNLPNAIPQFRIITSAVVLKFSAVICLDVIPAGIFTVVVVHACVHACTFRVIL